MNELSLYTYYILCITYMIYIYTYIYIYGGPVKAFISSIQYIYDFDYLN